MMKRLIGTITLILMMTGLCACSAQPLSDVSGTLTPVPLPVETVFPAPTLMPASLLFDAIPTPSVSISYTRDHSISIVTDIVKSESNFLALPHVMNCAHEDYYNECISSLTEAALKEVDRAVFADYSIETHNEEILSLALRFYDMDSGMPCGVYPITFDLSSAQVQSLPDYFSEDDDRWRRILPDIVTQQAEKHGITLLSELLPISDSQGFYIRGNDLVLIYHPYEIATYEAGVPEFPIPISSLQNLLREGSPLIKLIFDERSADIIYEGESAANGKK